jgi:hypothetical protein
MCPHAGTYSSSCYHLRVLILLCMCPHTTTYASSYASTRILLYVSGTSRLFVIRSLTTYVIAIVFCIFIAHKPTLSGIIDTRSSNSDALAFDLFALYASWSKSCSSSGVSICTFILVKQVNWVVKCHAPPTLQKMSPPCCAREAEKSVHTRRQVSLTESRNPL